MTKPKKYFYAVFNGRVPGIYESWTGGDGAHAQIDGYPKAKYKKFETEEEARQWMDEMKGAFSGKKPAKKTGNATRTKKKKSSPPAEKPEIKRPKNAGDLPVVTMYTDGACTGNPGRGGYGTVLLHKGKKRELSGGFRLTTNNRMEILACVKGLEALKKPCAVTLFSDSRYVVDAMEKGWAKRWKAKGWQRNKEQKAKNADLWKRMLELCEKHDVAFNWVKGHAGDEHNERCDRLAVDAAAKPDLPPDEVYEKIPDDPDGENNADNAVHNLECPECGAPMKLRNSKFGKFYGCSRFPECKAAHGAHPDGRPLGIPADAETKQWRMKAHDSFDAFWKSGDMKRNEAYDWLAGKMGLNRDECHIGRFDKSQCRTVVDICEKASKN